MLMRQQQVAMAHQYQLQQQQSARMLQQQQQQQQQNQVGLSDGQAPQQGVGRNVPLYEGSTDMPI